MIEAGMDHWQIVKKSLSGARGVDEQTFASLAILDERLERLKKVDKHFEKVKFSGAVKKLRNQKRAVALS
ncbi:MAG: hypothetical protein ACYSTF_06500 [Planctomycetota bacterium]|jgi:hypothetical protein